MFVLVAWTASAHAQTATLSLELVDGPDTTPPHITVDNNGSPTGQLRLGYSLQQGSYRDVTIDLMLPPWVTPTLPTLGTFTAFSCGELGVGQSGYRNCQWTLPALALGQQGLSGTVNLTIRLDRWRFDDQQPVGLTAQLSGFYTGPDGNPEHTIATDAATYTLIADAPAQFVWQSPTGFGVVGWTTRTIGNDTDNGVLLRLYSRPTNGGFGASKMRDLQVVSTFGDGLEILSTSAQSDWDAPVVTADVDSTDVSVTHASSAPPADNFTDSHYDTGIISIDVFVPCSALAAGVSGPSYAVTTVASWTEYVWNEATGSSDAIPHSTTRLESVPGDLGACGTGGGVNKANEWTPIPEDGIGLTGVSVYTPNGVASATNVLVVDAMPPGLSFAGFHSRSPAEFSFYACTFADKIGEDVTYTYFNDHLGDCTLIPSYYAPTPSGMIELTHLVGYAATWGGGAEPLQPFVMGYQTYAPDGWLADHPWQGDPPAPPRNTAFAKLDYELDGDTIEARPNLAVSVAADPWRADAEVRVVENSSCTQPWGAIDGPIVLSPRTPGQNRSKVRFYPNVAASSSSRLIDPHVTVTLPEGVTAVSTDVIINTGWGCTDITLESGPTVTGAGVLEWQFRGLEPSIGPGARCYDIVVEFETSPNGWRNNESFTITGEVTGTNARPACSGTYAFPFTVTMPAELRVEVEPTCQGNLGLPAFDISARNNGGDDFTGASLTFPIPEDTWLTSIEAPVGVELQCTFADGGGVGDCVGDLSDVVQIDAFGFDLAAPDEVVTVRANLDTNLPSFTLITASASASVDELAAPADSGESNPFVVDDCHWEIAVTKFFDANGDGKENQGDSRIPNWTFTISPGAGAEQSTAQTDENGVAHFFVRPGDYIVTEVLPAVVGGQVWSAFQGQTSHPVTMPLDPPAPVTTECANSCSSKTFHCLAVSGTCTVEGCTYVDEPDCNAAPVYWVPLRGPDGDSVVRCTVDTGQQPPRLVCDPPTNTLSAQCHPPEDK